MDISKKMHPHRFFLASLLFLLLINREIEAKSNPIDLQAIKQRYQAKKYSQVITLSKAYLKQHANDVDVKLYLGLAYYQTKNNEKSVLILNSALSGFPDYLEIRVALINNYIAQRNYLQAQVLINEGLRRKTGRVELLQLKEKIASIQKTDEQKLFKGSPKKHQGKNNVPNYLNEIGGYTSVIDVEPPLQTWNYSSLYFNRKLKNLSYGMAINYAKRATDAEQIWWALAPKITQNSWLDLNYAYSDKPEIFPNHLVSGEFYYEILQELTVSGGGMYRKIATTYLSSYTASIAKTIKQYTLSFRPIYFQPKSGPNSTLYRFHLRRYMDESNQDAYIGLIYLTGTSPDLFDLLTVNFFNVKEQIFLVECQFAVTNSLLLGLGGGYETQRFLLHRKRNLTYLNLGIKYKFA
jgi:YaiO family outer membrane protein